MAHLTKFRLAALAVLVSLAFHPPLHANDGLLRMATFNIEWLGHPQFSDSWNGSRGTQIARAATEILTLDADIVALQEVIVDDLNGNALLDLLNELNQQDPEDSWSGLTNDKFSFWWDPDFINFPAQRQAFVWRDSRVSYVTAGALLQNLPAGDRRFGSGRLPLFLEVEINAGGTVVPLSLINLHLKCCSGFDWLRNNSMTLLLDYLHANYADAPLVVLGDFNVADEGGAYGEIADWGFYADDDADGSADFFHAAGAVADEPWWDIDHILLSDELSGQYERAPEDTRNQSFSSMVSDHDPVITTLVWEQIPSTDYSLVQEAGQHYLQVTYRRRSGGLGTTGVDYTFEGLTYSVKVSPDLAIWQSGSHLVEAVGLPIVNDDGTETVTVRATKPLGATPVFLRLEISEAP